MIMSAIRVNHPLRHEHETAAPTVITKCPAISLPVFPKPPAAQPESLLICWSFRLIPKFASQIVFNIRTEYSCCLRLHVWTYNCPRYTLSYAMHAASYCNLHVTCIYTRIWKTSVKVADTQSMQVFCGLFFWGVFLVEKPMNWNNWIFLGKNKLVWTLWQSMHELVAESIHASITYTFDKSSLTMILHDFDPKLLVFFSLSAPRVQWLWAATSQAEIDVASLEPRSQKTQKTHHSDNVKMMVRLPQRVPWRISHLSKVLGGVCLFACSQDVQPIPGRALWGLRVVPLSKAAAANNKKMRKDDMRKILFLPKPLTWKMGPSKIGFL